MKKYLPLLIVVAAIAVGGIIWAARSDNKNSNTPNTTTNSSSVVPATPPNSSNSSNPAPSTATSSVTIQNFAFSPSSITVKKGTTVTWKNNDSTAHTVTSNSGQGPSSTTLSPGQSYMFTFNSAGTFNYHCTIHPEMQASVTVTD